MRPMSEKLPLLTRVGAAYECFGDGLCCTDIHGLGPLTKKELVAIQGIDPEGADFDDDFDDRMLCTASDGGCHFLMDDLRCGVHATLGPEAKPDGCRRFPLGLVATPMGGRVTTRHRCPCRTMGARPALTGDSVVGSLLKPSVITSPALLAELNTQRAPIEASHLKTDLDVDQVFIGGTKAKHAISFDAWLEIEAPMIEALLGGVPPEKVLAPEGDTAALGELPVLKKKHSWETFADDLLDAKDGSAFGVAAVWLGEAILCVRDASRRPRLPERPWKWSFDRAEARKGRARSEAAVLGDWVADEIWGLEWNTERGFDIAKRELLARVLLARKIASWISSDVGRAMPTKSAQQASKASKSKVSQAKVSQAKISKGRAMAEAVMIVELIGESDFWEDLVSAIKR